MSRTAAAPASVSHSAGRLDYVEASRWPWISLVFLLPLIIAYEVGTTLFITDPASGTETRIIAFTMLRRFLMWFGATGQYLPAFAVIGILLACHLVRKDRWACPPKVLLGMTVECVCWTVPLLGLGLLLARYLSLQAVPTESPLAMVVLSLGAGIYEELVFRLIAFAFCSFLLADVLGLKNKTTVIVTLLLTSVLFSLYHYLGWESPNWRTFVFRTLAGVFFGALYLGRGFGITAGTHAAYDVVVHLLRP